MLKCLKLAWHCSHVCAILCATLSELAFTEISWCEKDVAQVLRNQYCITNLKVPTACISQQISIQVHDTKGTSVIDGELMST